MFLSDGFYKINHFLLSKNIVQIQNCKKSIFQKISFSVKIEPRENYW